MTRPTRRTHAPMRPRIPVACPPGVAVNAVVVRPTRRRKGQPHGKDLLRREGDGGGAPDEASPLRAVLWAHNPDVSYALPPLFVHVGIILDVVDSAEDALRAATEGQVVFLVIDCAMAADAQARCEAVITRTALPVHVCHPTEEFVADLQRLAQGELHWLPPAWAGIDLFNKVRTLLAAPVLSPPPAPEVEGGAAHAPLTEREEEVYQLVKQGLTNRQIAARLQMSVSTVKAHLAHIRRKWGLHTRYDLLAHRR